MCSSNKYLLYLQHICSSSSIRAVQSGTTRCNQYRVHPATGGMLVPLPLVLQSLAESPTRAFVVLTPMRFLLSSLSLTRVLPYMPNVDALPCTEFQAAAGGKWPYVCLTSVHGGACREFVPPTPERNVQYLKDSVRKEVQESMVRYEQSVGGQAVQVESDTQLDETVRPTCPHHVPTP
jgi:hypothetical protein